MFDPNENLKQQERAMWAIARAEDSATLQLWAGVLAGLREGLRQWLADGGYEPQWERWPVAARFWQKQTR